MFILGSAGAFAQIPNLGEEEQEERRGSSILDDSTKQVYGPTTSSYTFLPNIKYNKPHYWHIDTAILDWHRFQFPLQFNNTYQDLGNIGTAMSPIFPVAPSVIGASPGFSLYDIYATHSDEVKYYDTKSPYSRFKIIWGGQGRSVTEASYTRNINPRSNFFFDYKGLFIDKQIGRSGRGDRNVQGINYSFGGNFGTKDGRYQAYGNFRRNNHSVDDYGGVLVEDVNATELFFDDDRQPNLTDAETIELRRNYQLYHQFKVREGFQVYHEFNHSSQQNDFITVEANDAFFDEIIEIDTLARNRSKMVYSQQEAGVKGDFGKSFYNFYYKIKNIDFDYRFLDGDTVGVETDRLENYVGARLRFGNDSISFIEAYGEFLLDGNFKLGGSIRNSWFEAEGSTALSQPSFMQQAYLGRHDLWTDTNFDNPVTTQVKGRFKLALGPMAVQPGASYTLLNNYIYFREGTSGEPRDLGPAQAGSAISVLSGDVALGVNFLNHMHFNAQVIYSNVSGGSADAVQLPDIFTNSQLYYKRISFGGNLDWQLGFDIHWRSDYFANGYDPAIMQYFVQESFEVPAFPVIDIFFNGKINRGRFFFKYSNLYELFNGTGYFTVPGYPGQSPILDFGFDWSFYD